MKKKLSRLLCALLVMTMVLAMVPAVSAAAATDAEGSVPDKPIVMYVGESVFDTDIQDAKCTNTTHTGTTIRYSIIDENGRNETTASTSSTYVKYASGKVTANKTTLTADASGATDKVAKITVTCSTKNCDKNYELTKYYKVYSQAKAIALRNQETAETITDSDSNVLQIAAGETITLDYSVLSATSKTFTKNTTAKQTAVECTKTSSKAVAVTVDTSNRTVTLKAGKSYAGTDGYFEITADTDATIHNSVTRRVYYTVNDGAVVTIKNNKTVVAKTGDTNATLDAAVGDVLTLTAYEGSSTTASSNVTWSSSNSSVAMSQGKGKFSVDGIGSARISAYLNGSEVAYFTLNVVGAIKGVEIQGDNSQATNSTVILRDGEMNNGAYLALKLKVEPNDNKDSAQFAVWSTSKSSVIDFVAGSGVKIDPDTGDATGATVVLKAQKAGEATIEVKLGGVSDKISIKVNKTAAEPIKIKTVTSMSTYSATVRAGTAAEIVAQMNGNSTYAQTPATTTDGKNVYVPVEWISAQLNSKDDTATVYGVALTSDGENTFDYSECKSTQVTLTVTLTDKPAVTGINITANKDVAVENDVVRLTAVATVEPSSADVEYQWYANGKAVSGGTKSTLSYTIPKASVDSSTTYKFTCEVTATNKGESTTAESSPFTVTVSRDYTVSVSSSNGKSSFNVGDEISMKATLYYKGSAVSNSSFSWQLFDTNENALDSGVATVTGSGNTAKINAKGAKSENGTKINVRATVDYKGYSYSSSETITLNPAEAATVKQSVGSGAALKASSITSAVSKAAGVDASYIVFDSPRNCTLTKSSSSSSTIGSTKCYVASSSSNQLLSSVYVKTSGTSASVGYTAYNSSDYVIATGTINFDSDDTGETLYASGASFKGLGAVDQIVEAYPEASYVKFDLPRSTEGKLYFDYDTIASYQREVKDSDKYYIDASSSQDSAEDVYFLPVYGVTGKIEIDYTAYSSSNSDLGDGTITLNIKEKTSSSKFTDVTYNNTGYWAASSIDFMSDNNLFNGTSTYRFSPEASMTRAMLVTVLYRAAGEPSVSGVTNPFTDVASKEYYYNAVLWAYKNNVVTGTSANKFSPDANVTREQIATILYRYMGSPAATGSLVGYTDRTKISSYAATAMQWAIGQGYITGTSATTLDPTGNATRAQVAVMLHRFLTK